MKRSKIYMLLAAVLLGGLFVLPLWNITLEAPQYPDSIGMNIYINKFVGANDNDIKNINIMNHYVGMKAIPEVIPEFSIFPYAIGSLLVLGLVFAFVGKRKLYLLWFVLMMAFATVAMYDFYAWEYDYGHDLNQNAPIKFTDDEGNPMSYQPPLIGAKTILNFRAISMPRIGAYLMAAGMVLSLMAFAQGKKEIKPATVFFILPLLGLLASSCEVKPEPIHYSQDACDFCRMTIVDQQHAAQLVTIKGRNYKYDAIECMVQDYLQWDRPDVKYFLVADYASPGQLTDAHQASYLISEAIPSPMGAHLTAFATEDDRTETHDSVGGKSLDWPQLIQEIKNTN
ncbi:nitrous oxide reductase accessory protein NosL [Reichenbachiella ulvae]|uniref:Nitrous oxide reductase accessory protein NosL n=1 Tax=Reichenbachiella ulvae TaxID=2980104 RepID=A0ABT3CWA1_9BACT|nr:nitrous oxide reductase accessory protein NosL [Reichenbachiella ulvae]MCV9387877.1 nitrous oxide reductase accessory protein NosL [Reichenbachiella ulvae]